MSTYGVILAARFNSSRLPGKAMKPINGIPTIVYILRRLSTSNKCAKIILATSNETTDDIIAETGRKEGVEVFRGSLEDVLGRFANAAKEHGLDYMVRATGDCPFINGTLLDYVIEQCEQNEGFDLLTTKPNFPKGLDLEVITNDLLQKINVDSNLQEDKEHIFNYVYRNEEANNYKIVRITPYSSIEGIEGPFLLDDQEDYDQITSLLEGQDIQVEPEVAVKA